MPSKRTIEKRLEELEAPEFDPSEPVTIEEACRRAAADPTQPDTFADAIREYHRENDDDPEQGDGADSD